MGSMVVPSQAYEVKLAPHPAPFSVFRFEGEEALGRLYKLVIKPRVADLARAITSRLFQKQSVQEIVRHVASLLLSRGCRCQVQPSDGVQAP